MLNNDLQASDYPTENGKNIQKYEKTLLAVFCQNVNLRNTFYLSRIQNSEENKSIKAKNKQEASIQSPQTTFSVL